MAMLDFIKNRQSQQQQTAEQPKPETAKQMFTREAGEERANQKPLQLTEKQEASVKEANGLFRQASDSKEQVTPTPAPSGGATDPQQPMVQPSMNQDKAAPDMSPTSAQAGGREKQQGVSVSDAPTPTPTPSPGRGPSPTRTLPSWER